MPEVALEQVFLDERPRLFQIAYRLMGTVSDAEDALQDVYVKVRTQQASDVRSPRPYLTQAVVRRCLDEWKSARRRREQYVGPWLPEPLAAHENNPAQQAEISDSVSLAFLVMLESLSPVERAVFLLHDVFQYPFDEISTIVEKTPEACRQLAHRARQRAAEHRPRYPASPEKHRQLVQRFMHAVGTGDLTELQAVLAGDVTAYSDGGGLTAAARAPIHGLDRVTRFLLGLRSKAERLGHAVELRPCEVNGSPGMLQLVGGRLHALVSFESDGERIRRLFSILNPEKLASIATAHGVKGVWQDA
jgi:RNA polymerase sigma-70 factor (ECF subfamily)